MVSPLKSLQSELVLKLDEIMDLCRRYNYKATPTLLLRHNDGAKASIMIGGDEPKEAVLCLAELGVTGNKSELSVRDAAIQSLMSELSMIKFVDDQSEVDRLKAVNAELLEALKNIANVRWRYEGASEAADIAKHAIAKATNQEAGR